MLRHALPGPEYRLALRVGAVPTPRVIMQAVFPWRQGMLCGDWIASVKFSLPERLRALLLKHYCAGNAWKKMSCWGCICPESGSKLLTGSVTMFRLSLHNT